MSEEPAAAFRGETSVEIVGRKYKLRPTLAVLLRFEESDQIPGGLLAFCGDIAQQRTVNLTHAVAIFRELVRAGGERLPVDWEDTLPMDPDIIGTILRGVMEAVSAALGKAEATLPEPTASP